MSDELRLPDDLAACEARLAGQPLPASGIDRDQLLYRAGWAAGAETARLASVNPPPWKGGARGGIKTSHSTATWSLTSAALAASLAVAITLQVRPESQSARVEIVDHAPSTDLPTAAHLADAGGDSSSLKAERTQVRPIPHQFSRAASLLAARDQVLRRPWDEASLFHFASVNAPASKTPTPIAKSARELLDEFLPPGLSRENADGESSQRRFNWPWQPATGETI